MAVPGQPLDRVVQRAGPDLDQLVLVPFLSSSYISYGCIGPSASSARHATARGVSVTFVLHGEQAAQIIPCGVYAVRVTGRRPRPGTWGGGVVGRRARGGYLRRRMVLPSHTSGSYLRSTTRSFIGMIALSVIWMCSGQTSVQHLVMLHYPEAVLVLGDLRGPAGRGRPAGACPARRRGSRTAARRTPPCSPRGRAPRGRCPGTGSIRCTCGTPATARRRPAASGTRPARRPGGGAKAGISPGLLVVERHVGDQVADHREGPHRRHRDRLRRR